MLPVPDWADHRFPAGLPIAIAPYVIERLRGTPARLADRVRDLPRPLLTRRDGERWSIQEHAGHLVEIEALHADYRYLGAAVECGLSRRGS